MRLLFSSLVIVLLMSLPINALSQARTKNSTVTNKEKQQVLVSVITDSLDELMSDGSFGLCTIPIVNNKKVLLINTDLPMKSPFNIGEFSFRVKSKKEIEREIKDNDGDCYFAASPLNQINVDKFTVTLWRHIEVINILNGKSLYPSRWTYALGRVYEVSRTNGKWNVKYLGRTEIIS